MPDETPALTRAHLTHYSLRMSLARRSARLRSHCERAGITLETLADEAGIPLDTIRKIDSGRREPLVTTALRLAGALGVDVEDVFRET